MKTLSSLIIAFIAITTLSANTFTVTNTNDNGSGSLRWAITESNKDTILNDTILFNIPTSDAGFDATRGVFVIKVKSKALPTINWHNLFIDGTSQTRFTGNTNQAVLGRGGVVGCDAIALSKVDGPEIEIVDDGNHKVGFNINGNNIRICGVSIYGFGNKFDILNANIVVCPTRYNIWIEKNVIGAPADAFTAPSTANGGSNIAAGDADSVYVRNNLIGFADKSGIYAADYKSKSCFHWVIENNEIISNGANQVNLDGIDIVKGSGDFMVKGNYIANNAASGIDTWKSIGNWTIENNTITGNGKEDDETSGIRVYGVNSLISKNKIESNYGAGVLVTSGASQHTISQNCICNNGNVMGNAGDAPTKSIGIDLIYSNENIDKGNSPYYTLNDMNDHDIGGNGVLNFPPLLSCELANGKLTVKGWTRPGSTVELFKACTYPGAVFPQGEEFIGSFTEGSNDDKNNSVSIYGPGPIQGLSQGEDSTNMFEYSFTAPSGLKVNDLLTSTATLNKNTSEFGGACQVTQKLSKVSPVLECVHVDSGTYTAVFGYFNPNNVAVTIPVSNQNSFVPSPQDRGQDTIFLPGRKWATFEVPFNGSNLVWKLNGKTSTANANSKKCYFDVVVNKEVSNAAPEKGDTIEFEVSVFNPKYRAMTNVEIFDLLNASAFGYISHSSSHGTYSVSSGKWNIPTVGSGDTAFLTVVATADTSGENFACLTKSDQEDGNPYNNCGAVAVCVKESSGGNDGGVESNGSLASKLAYRNYQRATTDYDFYKDIESLEKFNPALGESARSSVDKYIPTTGPNSSVALITSPTDLINISNAVDVRSVDYYEGNRRLGAILALTTKARPYEHTKVICDRLTGAVLTDIRYEFVKEKPFITTKLEYDDGTLDYAVSFVAIKKPNGTYTIDSRWNIEQYRIEPNDSVFNFQVWSIAPQETRKMVDEIISKIEAEGYTRYVNNWPQTLPSVYVKTGEYKNGNLELIVHNEIGASEIYVTGNKAMVENGSRDYIDTISPVLIAGNEYRVSVPTGYIFDAGFSISNDVQGGIDVLYMADGPWGVDIPNGGATEKSFEVTEHDPSYLNAGDYPLERGAKIEGKVKSYYTLFRAVKAANRSVDFTRYNQLEFKANATGVKEIELLVSKKGIDKWAEQFRITIPVQSGSNQYKVGFPLLESSNGALQFEANDVVNFSFVVNGDNASLKDFTLEVSEVKLNNGYVVSEPSDVEELTGNASESMTYKVYPNPSNGMIQMTLQSAKTGAVTIDLLDMQGRTVKAVTRELNEGHNNFILDFTSAEMGSYILRVNDKYEVRSSTVIIR